MFTSITTCNFMDSFDAQMTEVAICHFLPIYNLVNQSSIAIFWFKARSLLVFFRFNMLI